VVGAHADFDSTKWKHIMKTTAPAPGQTDCDIQTSNIGKNNHRGQISSSSRWFSSEDTGEQLVEAYSAKEYLVDIAHVFGNGRLFKEQDTSGETLQQIFTRCGNKSMMVAACLFKDAKIRAVEAIRVDIIQVLRREHGFRVKEDRRNEARPDLPPLPAGELGMKYHIDRAQQKWLTAGYFWPFFADLDTLLKWEVARYFNGDIAVNMELHCIRERVARCLLGQRTHSQILWQGGVYFLAAALDESGGWRLQVLVRCRMLCIRLMRAEEYAATVGADPDVLEFLENYVWGGNQPYRALATC